MVGDATVRTRRHSPPSESSILIVGAARNCESWIARSLGEVRKAVRDFRTVQWLIVESDSDDGTASQLDGLAALDPAFRVLHLGKVRKRIQLRTERLAFCRNAYLNEIKNDERYRSVDYVLVADLDGMTGALSSSGILSCWERGDWDVCTANQRGPYYDIWTLRHAFWSTNDCWKQCREMIGMGVSRAEAESAAVYSRKVTIPESAPWIEVESAFGGLAIYRRDALVLGSYHGLSAEGEEVSDHIALHRDLRAAGCVIVINPSLVNFVSAGSPDTDTQWDRLRRCSMRLLKSLVRRTIGEDSVTRIAIRLRRLRK